MPQPDNKALAVIRDRQRQRLVFGDELLNQLADEAAALDTTTFIIELPEHIQSVSVFSDASGTQKNMEVVDQRIELRVPALNTMMIEF